MGKQNHKAFYQSYPGIFTDITTHNLLILDPQLTSLCPKRKYIHNLQINHEETGDFKVAYSTLLLIPQ